MKDDFDMTAFAYVLVVLNGIPIVVGITRIVSIMRMVLQKMLGKRHIISELARKGAVNDALKTPKFPKISSKTLDTKEKKRRPSFEKNPPGSPKAQTPKKKKWFASQKKPKSRPNPTREVTRMDSLESHLDAIETGGGGRPAPSAPPAAVVKVTKEAEV